ncbi:dihydrolipoyl dehydrogenase [Haliea sp. E1-2-M8]|uniref:dihydrolipoyl dehydrogenase n=1 Tax=Haliea sp. E1-2-M8 TaxID=3064706 RepID=UPI002725A21C|nr:dihydrolipoyl dehydrogenase [Haliea sp. E1-2-M8]MDO8862920.1 dihydrolipoyl dehydrogenase [Haliea sp. E1-2-M8]
MTGEGNHDAMGGRGARQGASTQVDVVIIGAGSAGLAAVREVKKKTDSFVLINERPYGTTCARVGCMPSKALIEAANAYHARHRADAFGIRGSAGLSIDTAAVLQRVRALRDRFVAGVLKATESLGKQSIEGRARLTGPNTVEVHDQVFAAQRIIIATGSHPIVLDQWRKLGDRILTTDTFFEQETLPASMAVIGLGPLGVEMAQALARLGVKVHAFSDSDQLAGISDPAVSACLRAALSEELTLTTGHEVQLSATRDGVRVQAGPIDLEVEKVLVAIGRKPNLEDIGLSALGVKLNQRGLPPFDPTTMQIRDLPIFIAGDANAYRSVLHEAADEGFIAGVNAVSDEVACFERRTPLAVVFSSPGVAMIGQRHADLEPGQFITGCVDFSSQGRALTAQRDEGILRVYAARDGGPILGAEMCAPAAEHLAHLIALAIHRGLTAADLLAMPFYHPVLEEGLRTALREIARESQFDYSDLAACEGYQLEALD